MFIITFLYQIATIIPRLSFICNDTEVLRSLVPDNTSIDVNLVQSRVCGLNLNVSVLFDEVIQGIDGLKEVVDMVSYYVAYSLSVCLSNYQQLSVQSQLFGLNLDISVLLNVILEH